MIPAQVQNFGETNVNRYEYPFAQIASIIPSLALGVNAGKVERETAKNEMIANWIPSMVQANMLRPTPRGGTSDITLGDIPWSYSSAPTAADYMKLIGNGGGSGVSASEGMGGFNLGAAGQLPLETYSKLLSTVKAHRDLTEPLTSQDKVSIINRALDNPDFSRQYAELSEFPAQQDKLLTDRINSIVKLVQARSKLSEVANDSISFKDEADFNKRFAEFAKIKKGEKFYIGTKLYEKGDGNFAYIAE